MTEAIAEVQNKRRGRPPRNGSTNGETLTNATDTQQIPRIVKPRQPDPLPYKVCVASMTTTTKALAVIKENVVISAFIIDEKANTFIDVSGSDNMKAAWLKMFSGKARKENIIAQFRHNPDIPTIFPALFGKPTTIEVATSQPEKNDYIPF